MPVGPSYNADSSNPPASARYGRLNEAVVGQAHGKYYEATSRGNVYAAASVTGRAPGTSIGTTVPIALYNPLGSGKRLKIVKVTVAQAPTGTLGTGALFHCAFTLNGPQATQSGSVPTGTALTPQNCDVGAANNSVATVLSNVTLNGAPVQLYPFAQLGEAVGGTTAVANNTVTEDVDGNIVLEPGAGWCLCAVAAAGSSPLILPGVVWEEVAVG